nr:hypothetical protein [Mucilaginibacter sp. X4EP1]
MLILISVIFYTTNKNNMAFNWEHNPLFYFIPSFIIACGFAGSYLFNKIIKKAIYEDSLSGKLAIYRTAFIRKGSLIEGSTLLSIVYFSISGNLLLLLFAGLNIIYFATQKPTKSKIEDSLNLGYEDKIMLG